MGNAQDDHSKCNVVRIEFMTAKQREKKKLALKKWESELQESDDFNIVKSSVDLYEVDFRQEIYVPQTMKTIDVGFVMKYFDDLEKKLNSQEVLCYPELTEFIKTKVLNYFLIIDDHQVTDRSQTLRMSNCPIFEFVYKKRSFLDFLVKKVQFVARDWKKNFLKKIANFLGLGSLYAAIESILKASTSGIISALFSRKVLHIVGTFVFGQSIFRGAIVQFLKLFFPFAAPIIHVLQLTPIG